MCAFAKFGLGTLSKWNSDENKHVMVYLWQLNTIFMYYELFFKDILTFPSFSLQAKIKISLIYDEKILFMKPF